jgi:hypothetical protein
VAGGAGVSSSITGSAVARAGGGGGGADNLDGGNTGGTGVAGGGNGSNASSVATSGTANTGGGGGGGGRQSGGGILAGGNGGSGLVVAKYPAAYTMTVGAGLGYKTSISGDYKITEFTAGTGTVSFALETADLGPSEDILQEIVLESSAASVTFSGLDAYASDYQHLQIRMTLRNNLSTNEAQSFIKFNGDTGSNYTYHYMLGNGSSVSSGASTSRQLTWAGTSAGNTAGTNVFSASIIDILDPFETTKYTTTRVFSGLASPTNVVFLNSGVWMNTAALTSIELSPQVSSNNWVSGSRFTLIGVK